VHVVASKGTVRGNVNIDLRIPQSAWACPIDANGTIQTRAEIGPSLLPSALRPIIARSISALRSGIAFSDGGGGISGFLHQR